MSTPFVFSLDIQQRFADYDMFKHVNNTVYPQYVETARLHYYKEFIGVDLRKFLALTAALELEYVRPANFGDELAVQMRTKSIGNTSIALEFEIVSKRDRGIVYVRGEVRQVCCDASTGKPIRVPDEVRHAVVEREGIRPDEVHLAS